MKRFIRALFSVTLILGFICQIHSQSELQIHIGPSFPLSEFGVNGFLLEDGTIYDSYATIGISSGVKYSYRFNSKNLGLFGGMDFFYNGISKEYKTFVEDTWNPQDLKYHAYFNFPLSLGLDYSYSPSSLITLNCSAGIALNFLKISDLMLFEHYEFDVASKLGGKLEIGVKLKNRISFHLDYFGLGNHKVLVRFVDSGNYEDTTNLNIQMLTLTTGINF